MQQPRHSAHGKPMDPSWPTHPRYELIEEIGVGGMGVVYRARDRLLRREIALKILSREKFGSGSFVDRFIEEAQIASQLQHPGIVPIHDVGRLENGTPFFAMRLVHGRNLHELLSERISLQHDQQRWLDVFAQVCQAVAYAHAKGVVHRDLKPSNIMVGRFNEVQVMDWGIAKVLPAAVRLRNSFTPPETISTEDNHSSETASGTTLEPEFSSIQTIRYSPIESTIHGVAPDDYSHGATEMGDVMGTLSFMSPEQASGDPRRVQQRSDVFSLGGILAQILTGSPPYSALSSDERLRMAANAQLAPCLTRLETAPFDREWIELCIDCLRPSPDDRPKDAGTVTERISAIREAIAQRLHQAEIDKSTSDLKLEAALKANALDKKRRAWLQLATVASACLLFGGLGSILYIRRQQADLKLAESKEQVARLEQRQERITRLEQNRQAILRSSIPLQVALEEIESSQTPPNHSQLTKLSDLSFALEKTLQSAPIELREESDWEAMKHRVKSINLWSQVISADRDSIIHRAMEILDIEEPGNEPLLWNKLGKLPDWVSECVRVAILEAVFRYRTKSRRWGETLVRSEWERALWESIERGDIFELHSLVTSPEIRKQSRQVQASLVDFLIERGPSAVTNAGLQKLDWTLIMPTMFKGKYPNSVGLTETGWIVPNLLNGEQVILETQVPAEPIRTIRLETYCGPAFDQSTTWRLRATNNQMLIDSPFRSGVITAPFVRRRAQEKIFGPGLDGLGPENCHLYELRIERVDEQGDASPLILVGYCSNHTYSRGHEPDRAFDGDESTYCGLGHDQSNAYCSAIFHAQPQASWQWTSNLRIGLKSGNPSLWKNTSLRCFRLYFSKDPLDDIVSPLQSALALAEELERSQPGDPSLLQLMVRARHAAGVCKNIDREAAVATASTIATTNPQSAQALRFFANSVLDREPADDDKWYRRLLELVAIQENEQVQREIRTQIGSYQSERGDRMHKLLPEEAYAAYRESQRLSPDSFNRHGRLAFELLRRQAQDQAMETARKVLTQSPIDPDEILLYGKVALRTGHAKEACEAFERIDATDESVLQFDELQSLFADLSFLSGKVQKGLQILQKLDGEPWQSPIVVVNAAASCVREAEKDGFAQLFELWIKNDVHNLDNTEDVVMRRDRQRAWGSIGIGAIQLDEIDRLHDALVEKLTTDPNILNTINSFFDEAIMARHRAGERSLSTEHSHRLIDLFRQIQPAENRWVVRKALLEWLDGRTDLAVELLSKLDVDLDENAPVPDRHERKRDWRALAQVVTAAIGAMTTPSHDAAAKQTLDHRPVFVGQSWLGFVPEADRDIADWLWWEYRLRVP